MPSNLTVIDLFCGAGGLSEGFRQAGFDVRVGNDFDARAGETFAATHDDAVFLPGPIQNWSASQFLEAANLKKGELTVLVGGPPCQGYSVYNRVGADIPWPAKTHGPGLAPFVTVRDAISDLPALVNGEDRGIVPYSQSPQSAFQAAMRGDSNLVTNHSATKLSAVNQARMSHIPQGGSWRDIPFELLPEGMKRAKRSDHTKRYGRLRWDGLSSTILTKCDVHWGPYIHPAQERSLTVREAARFQSFPDWFEFKGSRTEQFVQVGNAVPPVLGKAIAEGLLSKIRSTPKSKAKAVKRELANA